MGKIAFGKAEIIDRIQEVSLAQAILTADTNYPFIKLKTPVTIILELNQ